MTLFCSLARSAIRAKQYDKVKYAVLGIHRASRKSRDRRKVVTLD
jgi:transportin-3